VVDVGRKRVLFSVRANKPRVMMSNTKLFTTAAALEAFGGKGTTVESLVGALKTAGLARVRGGVVGDGSLFDSELGPPRWQLNDTPPGPVGALQCNRGIVGDSVFGTQFAIDPAAFAAEGLQRALVAAGVVVEGTARAGPTPSGAVDVAAVQSPPLSTLVRLVNKPSDNLLAETLAKRLGLRAGGRGTRAAGVAAALRFGGRLGVRATIHTGSGAFPFPRAAPRQLVRLLVRMRRLRTFRVLRRSLPIAGRDGTLGDRMRSAPAQHRCRAKTGSHFSDTPAQQASVLSGYCRTADGSLIAFSIMMNRVKDVLAGHRRLRRVALAHCLPPRQRLHRHGDGRAEQHPNRPEVPRPGGDPYADQEKVEDGQRTRIGAPPAPAPQRARRRRVGGLGFAQRRGGEDEPCIEARHQPNAQ
jgi:hypothetical protein